MKVVVLGNGSTPWQNGLLIHRAAVACGKNVDFISYAGTTEQRLWKVVAASKPDWVFVTGIRSLDLGFLSRLANAYKLMVWDADAIDKDRDTIWRETAGVPHVIVNSTLDVVNRYKGMAQCLEWVPQYYDSDYYAPTISRLNPAHEIFDVAFLGDSDHDATRQIWLRDLKREGFKCCIRGSNRIADGSTLSAFGSDMANIYTQSKIAIDIKRGNFHYGDFTTSDRMYKAMGCGAMYLTFEIPQIERLFVPDRDLVCYSNYADMIEKIRNYLAHETDRELIALNGQREIATKHTLRTRIDQYWALMDSHS